MAAVSASRGPLSGFRILSLAFLYPGPFATMLLADLGAEVILVESPDGGDRTRRFPGHFEALNRNKRSVALNLKDPDGREAFLKLVATADVVLEGFRPGVMARLKLAPEDLRQYKPDLIFASISSYGQTGPLSLHGAHDLSLQAAAGLLNVPLGREAETPLPPLVLGDIAAANAAAFGIVCALLQRTRTGAGSTLDVSMLDSVVAWMAPQLVPAMNGLKPARLPPTDPGYGVFLSSDGVQFTLSISGEDGLWDALVRIVGLEDLAGQSEEQRIADREAIVPRLRHALASHPVAWLDQQFARHKVPFGPVNKFADVPSDPQVKARGMVVDFDAAEAGTLRYIRQPLVFDGQPTTIHSRAPALGEHTVAVLRDAGVSLPRHGAL